MLLQMIAFLKFHFLILHCWCMEMQLFFYIDLFFGDIVWTVVLDKTLESPLDCKEIQLVHSEGDQPWDFFGGNDAEAETPGLWPPHAKSWLIGKDSDAGRDWGQEEKGMTEDEMAGWHHWFDGCEFEWTPGAGDGQGGLVCCNSCGCRVGHDWATELNSWVVLQLILPQVTVILDGSAEARCFQMASLTFLANDSGCWLIGPRAEIICLCHTYPLFFQTASPGFFTMNTSSKDDASILKGQEQKLWTSWNWNLQDAQCHVWHIQAKAIIGPVPIPGITDIANWWKKQQTHCNGSLYQDVRNCWGHHRLHTKTLTLFCSLHLSLPNSLHPFPLSLSFCLSLSFPFFYTFCSWFIVLWQAWCCLTMVHLRPVNAECKNSLKSLTLPRTKFSLYKVYSFFHLYNTKFHLLHILYFISLSIISHICVIHDSPPMKSVNSKLSPNNCQSLASKWESFL